ncbi:uncharacterized protein LOC143805342 [Ranitomeya variabilis]|uniref:uncharacterized protein LOC143805342 n=1 Tax=Ranitomeya variabilis TaxID=490064 RepID=UPI004056A552
MRERQRCTPVQKRDAEETVWMMQGRVTHTKQAGGQHRKKMGGSGPRPATPIGPDHPAGSSSSDPERRKLQPSESFSLQSSVLCLRLCKKFSGTLHGLLASRLPSHRHLLTVTETSSSGRCRVKIGNCQYAVMPSSCFWRHALAGIHRYRNAKHVDSHMWFRHTVAQKGGGHLDFGEQNLLHFMAVPYISIDR